MKQKTKQRKNNNEDLSLNRKKRLFFWGLFIISYSFFIVYFSWNDIYLLRMNLIWFLFWTGVLSLGLLYLSFRRVI